MKIFLVEDDQHLAQQIQQHLERYNYQVTVCQDFQQVTDNLRQNDPQLVLMDVNLPYFDGFFWCLEIRKFSTVPLIFLSAREHPIDQVRALECGADDYITKPFSYELLLAKIKSHLRRVYGAYNPQLKENFIEKNGLTYYPERLSATYLNQTINLSKKEGDLLGCLLEKFPQVCDRKQLLALLWDDEQFVDDNTLSVNVTRLRKKLAELGLPNTIQTLRSMGYGLSFEEIS